MSIAIIGAGNVGQALARAFTAKGETVFFGVPDPEKYRAAVERISSRIKIGSVPVFMLICGDDAVARNQVKELATLIGFDAVDMGELKAARYLEPFAMTWIHLAIKMGYGRNFAFSLIMRSSVTE
jgi:predicted dinucleotide-binding enzyme